MIFAKNQLKSYAVYDPFTFTHFHAHQLALHRTFIICVFDFTSLATGKRKHKPNTMLLPTDAFASLLMYNSTIHYNTSRVFLFLVCRSCCHEALKPKHIFSHLFSKHPWMTLRASITLMHLESDNSFSRGFRK